MYPCCLLLQELTYDYFFEHYGRNLPIFQGSFQCKCGAINCRYVLLLPLLLQ
jgi:hypothetical protein